MEKLTNNPGQPKHVLFILRLHFSNGSIRTLNKMVKLTKLDLKFLIDLLNDKVQTSQDGYKSTPLNAITFAYAIVEGKISSNSQLNSNVKFHTIFSRYKLPISLEPLDYGTLIHKDIKSLMIKQYNKYNIYFHNLANFDGIFLLKILSNIKGAIVQPILHKGKLVQITFKLNKIKVIFRDSLQMMPISIRKLAKSFDVTNKSFFPHSFVNTGQPKDNINYIGNVPDFSLFSDITLEEYNEYKLLFHNNWSLKEEAIKYCNIDCISLYQIIDKFSELIFSNFYVNIHNYATLPSLAFAIFRSNFLPKDTICQLSGEIANNIRKGYTGGGVDMYIPKGDNIFAYDVNSLYPAVMKNNVFPINNPVYFNGNIRSVISDAFGYFYCKVTAPQNLQYPVLQTHVETKDGIRSLAGLGTFEMMIFIA